MMVSGRVKAWRSTRANTPRANVSPNGAVAGIVKISLTPSPAGRETPRHRHAPAGSPHAARRHPAVRHRDVPWRWRDPTSHWWKKFSPVDFRTSVYARAARQEKRKGK